MRTFHYKGKQWTASVIGSTGASSLRPVPLTDELILLEAADGSETRTTALRKGTFNTLTEQQLIALCDQADQD